MVDYREIFRLGHEGCSKRSIVASVHSTHHTVSDVLDAAKEKKLFGHLMKRSQTHSLMRFCFRSTIILSETRYSRTLIVFTENW